MPIRVDGETYHYQGLIDATRGAGDNLQRLNFTAYTGPDGRSCWLSEDKQRWYLYRDAPEGSDLKGIETHETFAAHDFSMFGRSQPPVTFSWVTLDGRQHQETGPFQGTDQAMSMGPRQFKLAIPLVRDPGTDDYYGPNFPAAKFPRRSVRPGSAVGPRAATALLLLLAATMGWAVWAQSSVPLTVLWWAAPVFGLLRWGTVRHSFLHQVFGVISGLFFFHFATHGIDYWVTHNWDEELAPLFESARLGLACLLFLLLRALFPRFYLALLEGSYAGGGSAWVLYFSVLFLVLINEDGENYFPWFNWYASIPPWSWIWPLLLLGVFCFHYRDYRRAPVDRAEFRRLLFQTAEVLRQGLGASVGASRSLERMADDLEDALSLSADPAVRAFTPLAGCFLQWCEQAKALRAVDLESLDESTRRSLEADLEVLVADFDDLVAYLDAWPKATQQLLTLRISSRLLTWEW